MHARRHSLISPLGLGLSLVLIPFSPGALAAEERFLTLDDLAQLRKVEDPQISPDGEWVAYTVTSVNADKDAYSTDIWMTRWDGSQSVQLTFSNDDEKSPRWSPDGKYLAFLSSRRAKNSVTQVWLLNRGGGEARKLTDLRGSISDYTWSPDSSRLALIAKDPDPPETEDTGGKPRTPKPIVLDRFQFMRDFVGFLGDQYSHLYLFDLKDRKSTPLTHGEFTDTLPSWSPDGRLIAFVSKRGAEPDRHNNWDIYLIEPREGARAHQLTKFEGADAAPGWSSPPAWSPDGKQIVYMQDGSIKMNQYMTHDLVTIPVGGGEPRLLAPSLDRSVKEPRWSADGQKILFLLEGDRRYNLASISSTGGDIEMVFEGDHEIRHFTVSPGGNMALLRTTSHEPAEVFALENDNLRPLSRQNEEWLAGVKLGSVEGMRYKSPDGAEVHGLMIKPPNFKKRKKYPTLLRMHGGPVDQRFFEFRFDWQFFAANGYVVVSPNYRGSSGRGEDFSLAINADWGNEDAVDSRAAIDHVLREGIADPDRLGVGGLSWGGILTNYVIARDPRFKAAVSRAGASNFLAGYGTDHYAQLWEAELGRPWENPQLYIDLSYPFFEVDKITTPTLFLCGEKDWNVPLINSEQMYQALRSLGIDTQLVVYPNQHHTFTVPSYDHDRLERTLAWYDKYLKK
ncbi:MAG: S9 family peptidase [Acidobacteria bacterium]|nr:S9 family peptidase [Acidobacteriota bacterium]